MSNAKPFAKLLLLTVILALLGCAPTPESNAPFIRPKPYQFLNPNADFDFLVWSENKTALIIGGFARFKVYSTADAYLNLYAIDSSYKTLQLLANYPIHAKEVLSLGGLQGPASYRLTPPPGTETYIAIATQKPFDWLETADIRRPGDISELALNAGQLTDRLLLALEKLDSASWDAVILERRVEWPRQPSVQKLM